MKRTAVTNLAKSILVFSLIAITITSCTAHKNQKVNAEYVASFVGKSLGDFLDESEIQYDSWTPSLEEGWVVGCSFHFEDNEVKAIYVAFELPPTARISMSGDWSLQELKNEVIKGYAVHLQDTVIWKDI